MNIGIFTDAYYPQINGVVISTQILKNELENLGHNVTIITVSDPKIDKDPDNVLRLKSIPFAVLPNFRVGSLYSRRVMKELKSLDLDIIHTQTEFSLGIFARIVAKQLNIPIVHTYHTLYEDYTHYFSPKRMEKTARKMARKMSCYICNSVNSVIVPTEKVENKLIEYGLNKEVSVIPTGVDIRPFSPLQYTTDDVLKTKTELGFTSSDKIILFVGRIAKEKSIDVIIKALPETLKNVPNAKMLVIGDGPEMGHLKKLAKSLAIADKVIFAGKKPWSEIGQYYQVADLFVSASTSETQGLTYIEAMAARKPVIAKYDTNLEDTITDGINGRFFYEDQNLAPLMTEILNDDLLSHYLAKNAYDTAKTYSSVKFGESVQTLYYETLSSRFYFDKKAMFNIK